MQTEIAAVTGDDAAMSTLGVGADFKEFQKLFAPRVAELASDVIEPLDQLSVTVARLEQELHELRLRQLDETTEKWNQYKTGYERYLRPEPLMEEEESGGEDLEPTDVIDAEGPADTVETREPALDGDEVEGAESAPAEAPAQMDDSSAAKQGGIVVMKAGDILNGYRILEDFKVVGAGLSKWTFAERGGRQYFIKEFLSPTYPDDDAPGSEKIKAKKRARCAAFEAHHRGVQRALAPLSAYGGNLIVTLDFFRWGAKYYKVTEKVDAEGLSSTDVTALGLRAQLVLMKTVAHSLKILHQLKIVHSDLKPSNVLIKRTELGYTTKLIDFDSAYIAGRPPPPEEIVGTINYYSPELLGYIQEAGVAPGELGVASDIFALGLIYTEYLTGAPPPFDVARYHEPAVAVRSGETLRIPRGGLPPQLADLIDAMLLPDPARRPTIGHLHATLMTVRPEVEGRAPSGPPSALRGKGLRTASPGPSVTESRLGGRLLGKLVRKRPDPPR